MRSRTAKWFECTCQYEKTMEDGLQKKVKETNVVDALSFAEAEERFIEEMASYISGEFDVTAIKIAPYKEIFFSDRAADDRWYKAKVAFITLDEKSGKEKRQNVTYLVQAASLDGAIKNVNDVMQGSLVDYSSISVNETNIFDVFEYVKKEEKTEE